MMRRTFLTARRVLQQLSHDKRTLALLFVAPPAIIAIFRFVFGEQEQVFNYLAPALIGIFPLVMMFLVTSIATLGERKSGTLARLMSMPVGKADFLLGYALAFAVLAAVQATITGLVIIYGFGIEVEGGEGLTIFSAILSGLLGTSMGLFASAFARTEFQAIQFMPVFIVPQLLTCGLLVPRAQMNEVLQWLSDILPMTYSNDLMTQITITSSWSSSHTTDVLVILGFAVGLLILGALTIRRREKP